MNIYNRLNLIVYPVGSGGNFLSRLFGLSDNTQFLWKTGTCGCTPVDDSLETKLKYYWYNDEMHPNWFRDAHLTPAGFELCHDSYALYEKNSIIISCIHPRFIEWALPTDRNKNLLNTRVGSTQKIFLLKISDHLYNTLSDNLNLNRKLYNEEDLRVIARIKETLDYEIIDMDLLTNDETCMNEYARVCELMGITPIDLDIALSFINNWKSIRLKT